MAKEQLVHVRSIAIESFDIVDIENVFIRFQKLSGEALLESIRLDSIDIQSCTRSVVVNMTFASTEFACVIYSSPMDELGYTEFNIVPGPYPVTLTSRLISTIASFGQTPSVTLSVSYFPLLHISVLAHPICVETCERYGGVFVASLKGSGEFRLELRVLAGIKLNKKATLSGSVRLVNNWLVLESDNSVIIEDTYELSGSKKKIEIVLCKISNNESREMRVLDVFSLERLRLDTVYPVGNAEAELMISVDSGFSHHKSQVSDILRNQFPMQIIRRMEVVLAISGDFSTLIEGTLTSVLLGFGYEKLCLIQEKQVVNLTSTFRIIVELNVFSSEHQPAVIGIILRNKTGLLSSIHSLPLVDGQCYKFENCTVTDVLSSVKPSIDTHEFAVPIAPINSLVLPKSGARVHLRTIVRSIRYNEIIFHSCFVAIRIIRCSICPILLSMTEVIDMQKEFDEFGSACTPSREMVSSPIFESELKIELVYDASDWVYFVLFDSDANGNTCPIGHACLPVNSVCKNSEFDLPLIDVSTCEPLASSLLSISFPFNIVEWATMTVKQLTSDDNIGEVSLHVHVFRKEPSLSDIPVRSNHVWLPIKPIYPLYISDCPPSGFLQFELRTLSGACLSTCTTAYTDRYNEIACGRIQFSYSKSAR